ncbi:hypothetical protein ANN_16994 [Periplaneta americana]|uniref:Reverse transcriptase domain-containing protein n=1 Tax=Periplaneta americana TaxID=6978 RepID=A0ABQ8ST40_PERAM|nr:hypothetical protein ANN_16994 [Periplaneta americana]
MLLDRVFHKRESEIVYDDEYDDVLCVGMASMRLFCVRVKRLCYDDREMCPIGNEVVWCSFEYSADEFSAGHSSFRADTVYGSTEQFNIDNGLKQGDALAPMLFNLALHWVITQKGIDPNSTLVYKSVQIVGYADDLHVMGRSLTAIEEVYKDLEQGAAKIGLQINASKTKRMTQIRNKQNIYNPPNLTINMFEETEKFKYLGTVMISNNNELIEVQSRITAANKAYFALSAILKSNCVHKETKLKIYKTIIRSILCYASETWTLSKKKEAKLGIFERKILRRIFGPMQENMQWRIRYNNELYKLYRSFDIVTFIKLRRLEWAVHVYRMEGNRIPKKILEEKIHGSYGLARSMWTSVPRKNQYFRVCAHFTTYGTLLQPLILCDKEFHCREVDTVKDDE